MIAEIIGAAVLEKLMVVINSHFIADFNFGRNIHHNVRALGLLYRAFKISNKEDQRILCKPIIVMIGSICEAILHDFHYRIHTFTREGIRAMPRDVLDAIRGTSRKKDEFYWLIKKCEENAVFHDPDDTLFTDLKDLRKLRNRVHIQNKEKSFEDDEPSAFSFERKIQAERALEGILVQLTERYGRGNHLRYVDDFELPWEAHVDRSATL